MEIRIPNIASGPHPNRCYSRWPLSVLSQKSWISGLRNSPVFSESVFEAHEKTGLIIILAISWYMG
jgi:hypothetical protein